MPLRRFFRLLNRFFMVPVFRLGLGPVIVNPFSGYIMVLKVTGHRSGKTRYTPVNYAIMNGRVYCVAGFGVVSDWYRNVKSRPDVEAILPARKVAGTIAEVDDADEALAAMRSVMVNSGFAGFAYGFNPRTVSGERLREATGDFPVLSLSPSSGEIAGGAADPGGRLWLALPGLIAVIVIAMAVALFSVG
jgi:deazaflavin-dependent oxidoreductase (nitroreductase family)